jgi:hypothetical protein
LDASFFAGTPGGCVRQPRHQHPEYTAIGSRNHHIHIIQVTTPSLTLIISPGIYKVDYEYVIILKKK